MVDYATLCSANGFMAEIQSAFWLDKFNRCECSRCSEWALERAYPSPFFLHSPSLRARLHTNTVGQAGQGSGSYHWTLCRLCGVGKGKLYIAGGRLPRFSKDTSEAHLTAQGRWNGLTPPLVAKLEAKNMTNNFQKIACSFACLGTI